MKKCIIILKILLFSVISEAQVCSSCGSSGWASSIPTGRTRTFTVPTLTDATYVWVVTGNLSIVSGQGTPTVSIKAGSVGSGSVFVTRFKHGHSACADFIHLNITGAPPSSPSNLDFIIEPCETVLIRVNPIVEGATGYNFYINGVLKQSSASTDYYISLVNPDIQPGIHTACVSAYNSFGTSSLYCETFEVTCVGGAGGSYSNDRDSEVYPNPVISFLKVADTVEEVELTNTMDGNTVRLVPENNFIDVSSLRPGIYMGRFISKNGIVKQRIVIGKN